MKVKGGGKGLAVQIGELAEVTGASARSLRHYEEAGLLEPARRPNGYREYGPAAVERVRRIRALLAAGLSLAELGPLLSCVTDDRPRLLRCPRTAAVVEQRVADLDRRIRELADIRHALVTALAGPEPAVDRPDPRGGLVPRG